MATEKSEGRESGAGTSSIGNEGDGGLKDSKLAKERLQSKMGKIEFMGSGENYKINQTEEVGKGEGGKDSLEKFREEGGGNIGNSVLHGSDSIVGREIANKHVEGRDSGGTNNEADLKPLRKKYKMKMGNVGQECVMDLDPTVHDSVEIGEKRKLLRPDDNDKAAKERKMSEDTSYTFLSVEAESQPRQVQ